MQQIIKTLPSHAGVYQYFDNEGKILYVGKAKNLKNRVKSYWKFVPDFTPNYALNPRIIKMLKEATVLEYIVVNSEEDALILENSLIKQLKPKYNVLLRDDKTYPYICIDESQDFPRFEITRKIIKGKNITYYGPFPSGAKILLDTLYETYPLIQKKNCLKGKKACLFHQIGKCLAPCEGKISKNEYNKIVTKAKESIIKKENLISAMQERMLTLATNERFEEAAKLRDDCKVIESLAIYSTLDIAKLQDCDAIAILNEVSKGIIVKLFIRNGKVVSSDYDFFRFDDFLDLNEAYTGAILNLYKPTTPDIPSTILVAHDFEDIENLSKLISKIIDKKINIVKPQMGYKKNIIDLAITNAKELLSQKSKIQKDEIELKIQSLFELKELPINIEIFDNSHHQGDATVGAMVSWQENEWEKTKFRRFILEAKDEYGQMKELITRRIENFSEIPPPNLWVLDGGMALLNLAKELLKESAVNIDVIAISKEKIDSKAHRAKGSAKDIIYTSYDKFNLLPTDERLQFVQKLRDEAHRFAISFHRQKKNKLMLQSKILQKKGIGQATIKKLLNHFGTFEAINKATQKEIESITSANISKILKN
ncbi:MAG: excinuclease ABC subunit UvrC [Sulfurovaceae bacterium]|nr:excinuclease ABC subunit UvrC [Sulfurovaceae bacterium]MDD5548496.1 excinuclease ABC subunit UvrC [Sulfurovaceae bacterium]